MDSGEAVILAHARIHFDVEPLEMDSGSLALARVRNDKKGRRSGAGQNPL
jgi:hypothetical protein